MKKIGLILLAVTLCLTLGYGKALAQPVVVVDGGIGDVLLFPIYDVRDTANRTAGWQNYFVIENTSGLWTACHLRFRSWRKSIEVYDHIVLLSPFDVFWGVIERDPGTDNVRIWSRDTQTLLNSGFIYPPDTTWEANFQDFLLEDCGYTLAGGYNVNWEKQAGYVEVIGLWQLDAVPTLLPEDTHVLANVVNNLYDDGHVGNINVYDVLEALFYDWPGLAAPVPDWPTAVCLQDAAVPPQYVVISNASTRGGAGIPERPALLIDRYGFDCPNVLTGAFQMGDVTNGQFQRGNFIALADFRTDLVTLAGFHRDTYEPGGIIFDTNTMFWVPFDLAVPPADPAYYINENWATTVGPGLRDGDDWFGFQHTIAIDGFNDIWSLDEVEIALAKVNIWSDYYNGAFGAAYSTDVVLTFPTKHYHWFFVDWPFWSESAPPLGGAPFATLNAYWNALAAYRGGGPGAVESPLPNAGLLDIARWFLTNYDNGPIGAASNIWDTNENIFGVAVGEPPPGSPWHPVLPAAVDIPHEVNICEVGAALGTGAMITDVNGLLDTNADMGHFQIFGFALNNGQRENAPGIYGAVPPYVLPPTGVVILDLVYGAGLDRSTMSPWHYN
jgi:hypothetical protein